VGDLRDILEAFEASCAAGESAVLATVVHVSGSTYRRPGARLLVTADETAVGLISGGCLEGDLTERARAVRESGEPLRVRYDSTADDDIVWGLGLGCAGVVDVLLQRVSSESPGPLRALARSRAGDAQELATAIASHGPGAPALGSLAEPPAASLARVRREGRRHVATLREGALHCELLVERLEPPRSLLVCGAGPDAVSVVRFAAALDFAVTVLDARPAYARAERFPDAARVVLCDPERAGDEIDVDARSAAIVMTHHYLHDRALLGWLLASPAPYVGLLGPKQRGEDLLADLRKQGICIGDEERGRLYHPAGLDIGAEGPDEIAIALLAEVRAVLAGRRGRPLRERKAPIHDPSS